MSGVVLADEKSGAKRHARNDKGWQAFSPPGGVNLASTIVMETLSPADFEGSRLKRAEPYAVCFSATWCPFCRDFLPHFEGREGTLPVHLAVADVTDMHSPLWDTFAVKVVPTLVGFRDGALAWRINGRRFRGLSDRDLEAMAQFAAEGAAAAP